MVGSVWLVVYALAVCRVTSLVTQDEITRSAREWVGTRLGIDQGRHPHLNYLITCPWCASWWIGIVAAPLVYWFGTSPWLFIPALALAFSFIAGATSRLGRD